MEKQKTSRFSHFLKLDYDNEDHIWLSSSYSLRKLIGILGMLLPLLLVLFTYFYSGLNHPLESISHYYYTRAGTIFTVILSMIAIFLIIYSGKDSIDFYISCIAGIFALCVVLFPTSNLVEICCDANSRHSVTFIQNAQEPRVWFHYISAGIFLSCLAYMSIALFTKSNPLGTKSKEKIIRNRIYRICGVLIIVTIIIIGAGAFEIIPKTTYDSHKLTFWMEALAVESFGFAWLIKGETLFRDRTQEIVA